MEKYSIAGTSKTPAVFFDLLSGVLEIKGRSTPEDALAFYDPLFDALAIYAESPKPTTTVDVYVEYLLTSSAKCILEVFKILSQISKSGNTVNITWRYEEDDDDMLETGKDFQKIVNLTFEMVMVKD